MTELLAAFKAKRNEVGSKTIALELGIAESTVRVVCTGHHPNPSNILSKFERHFMDVVNCPYVQRVIELEDCKSRCQGPRPFGGAAKQAWWSACQRCEYCERAIN
jgi:hypothetical protein